jgi:predicted enzyme related to lactoylglutathione lyase
MTASLKFAFVVARNVGQLRDFYSSALGLPVRFQDGDKWCQLNGGRADVALGSGEEAHPVVQGTAIVYQVDDLADASQRVITAGGSVLATRDMGSHGQVATCRDIEGNVFRLFASAPKNEAQNPIKE